MILPMIGWNTALLVVMRARVRIRMWIRIVIRVRIVKRVRVSLPMQ